MVEVKQVFINILLHQQISWVRKQTQQLQLLLAQKEVFGFLVLIEQVLRRVIQLVL